ncbi:MAG: Crp/Fnr family transcriptional regulator [Deltaproteobacteria bacterium]|nr:Crp/Fnr family transcriptional regulator [Deltaproteobacteria bacterium]
MHSGKPIEPEAALQGVELFRVLSPERLARLRPRLREKSFQRQQVLYFEGSPADRLWVVRTGQVRLYKSSSDGQLTTLDVLAEGEAFGVLSALETHVYPASAEAVTAGSAWWLPRESFQRLLEEEPALNAEILRILLRRLREAHDRLRSFAHDPAPARLAAALLRAAAPKGEAHVTRRALAEAAGTTVETAIRVLRRLEREGIVEGRVGCIRIVDESRLREVSRG